MTKTAKPMKKLLNNFISIAILLAFCLALPIEVLAIGQISKPIVIKDALRGQNYQEEIVVFNTEKSKVKIGLSAEGQIKDWVKFYNLNDAKNAISEVDIKAGSNLKVNAVIHIPDSQPNGEYKGLISATSKPTATASTTESQALLSQKIDRPVAITVNDNQILKFDVSVIPKDFDLAKDEALSIRIIYDNQGNIDIGPQMQVKIKKDEQTVYNMIYPYPENTAPVKPNSRYEIPPITIQTTGYAKGEYLAEFNFLINNESKLSKKFAFSSGVYDKNTRIFGWLGFDIRIILFAVLALIAAGAVITTRKYFNIKRIVVENKIESDNE